MKSFFTLFRDSFAHFSKYNASRMGAALSYYAVFSIAPLTILLIALVGSIFGTKLAESSIIHQLDHIVGNGSGTFVDSIITGTTNHALGLVGTVVSLVTILFAAVSVLTVLDSSLDELWESRSQEVMKKGFLQRVWRMLKNKFPAFSIVPLFALLFLFFVAGSVFLSLYQDRIHALRGIRELFWLIEPASLFILGTAFFTLIYRILPDRKLPVRDILFGGLVTSFLFLLGRILIGYYIESFAHTTLYGAAGSFAAILIWIYYSSQVLFFGASMTYVYSQRRMRSTVQ